MSTVYLPSYPFIYKYDLRYLLIFTKITNFFMKCETSYWLPVSSKHPVLTDPVTNHNTSCLRDIFLTGLTYPSKLMNIPLQKPFKSPKSRIIKKIKNSLVVRISACHVEGPGSIPGRGETFFLHFQYFKRKPSGFYMGSLRSYPPLGIGSNPTSNVYFVINIPMGIILCWVPLCAGCWVMFCSVHISVLS